MLDGHLDRGGHLNHGGHSGASGHCEQVIFNRKAVENNL